MEKKFVLVWLQKLSPGQSNDGPDESEIDLSSANFSLLKTTHDNTSWAALLSGL
jgi:hypothetical protein